MDVGSWLQECGFLRLFSSGFRVKVPDMSANPDIVFDHQTFVSNQNPKP